MKRITLYICALLCAVASMYADPIIKWDTYVYDFGAFSEDMGPVSCRIGFTNVGDSPLVITAARASCGCTSPKFSREPVAPGDTASIVVTYDPAGRPGRFKKDITIDTNTQPSRSKLHIKGVVIGSEGTVVSRYPMDMGRLKVRNGAVMLGQVKKGHIKNEFLDGYNISTDTLHPVALKTPRYIEVSSIPKDVPPGEQVALNFYVRTDRCPYWGIVTDSVTIAPDAKHPEENYTLPVVVIVEEDFSKLTPDKIEKAPKVSLSPETADFDKILGTDAPQTRSVKICNTGRETMQIRRVYTTDPGVTVTCDKESIKKGKCATITVTVDPRQIKGTILNSRISIITNSPEAPTTVLRVTGY